MIVKIINGKNVAYVNIADNELSSQVTLKKSDKYFIKSLIEQNRDKCLEVEGVDRFDVELNFPSNSKKMLKAFGAIK